MFGYYFCIAIQSLMEYRIFCGRTTLKDSSCFGPAVWHGASSVWNQLYLGGSFVLAAGWV